MALDWPAFGDALWRVNDELGIAPEWVLPVLYLESRFDPAATSPSNCVGLNQLCTSTYPRYVNVPVSEYRTWTASQQLSGPVFNYWRDALAFGPIDSAARLMLSQLGHGLLRTRTSPDSVVFSSPSAEYNANSWFDTTHKGYFTMQDLANALASKARSPEVQDAIARAYAMRPEVITAPSETGSGAKIFFGLMAATIVVGFGTKYLSENREQQRREIPVRRIRRVSPNPWPPPSRRWSPPRGQW